MINRIGLAFGQQLSAELFFDIAIFGVNHDNHAVFGGHLHGFVKRLVVNLEDIFVGHEQFNGGDALIQQRGDFVHDIVAQVADNHMETVVNLGRFGFFAPCHEAIMQAAASRLIDKVDVHGRAAEGRRFMPDIEVVVAKCAAEGQIKMGMHVDATGQ